MHAYRHPRAGQRYALALGRRSHQALVVMAASVAIVDPGVLAVLPLGTGASSLLSTEAGLALMIAAALLVLGYLVVSSWLSLRSAIRAMTRQGEATA